MLRSPRPSVESPRDALAIAVLAVAALLLLAGIGTSIAAYIGPFQGQVPTALLRLAPVAMVGGLVLMIIDMLLLALLQRANDPVQPPDVHDDAGPQTRLDARLPLPRPQVPRAVKAGRAIAATGD